MVYDIDMLRNFYANFPRRVDTARERIGGRPMTLAEKDGAFTIHERRKRKIRSTGYRALRPFDPSEYGSQNGYRYGYQEQ